MRASWLTNPIALFTNSRVRRYWNPLSLTQLIGRKLVGRFATEILAVDRVDARHLVRPSTVDQSLSSRSLDDPRSLTPAT